MTAAIRVRGLHKTYGGHRAVDGLDLDVHPGEVFSLLGPNGAGKTTTVEILEGFRTRDGGEVSVLGTDPQGAPRSWRDRIGIVLQTTGGLDLLTPREVLRSAARCYRSPRDVDDVIEVTGLAEKADRRVSG
ncbi:ATP-binding cassette domain-containing protein, partial [Phycicoccus flavus]|uniref:ATP-binding cassette domain-containing protein n=1 Tax=Phycicoccus flavus TaxID=2502783 RepID=UPI000FF1AFFF